MNLDRLIADTFIASAEHHATLGSTNDRARELAEAPTTLLPALIVADEQTAGRGRRSNRWWTGRGSLAFSLLLDPAALGVSRQYAPQLSLAAAVALVDVVRALLPGVELGLHWPNDVFAANRKLAGILVEALADGRHIVGIGLNTNNTLADAPPELHAVATTMRDLADAPFDHAAVLAAILRTFESHLRQLAAQPANFGRRYDDECLQRGETLTIQHGQEQTTGRCLGIAADGALLLDTPTGQRAFYGGFLIH